MTERLCRRLRDLRENGQAWGALLMWAGLAAFAAASPISIAATNIAWVVALVGFLLRALQRDARPASLVRRTDLDAPLLLFAAASLVSVFLSLDITASLFEYRSLGLMVIFFLFAWQVRTVARRKVMFGILFAFSSVSALYGWVQFLTGWDLLGHYQPASGRVCGTFGLHLTYGEYLSMVICTGTGILLQSEGTRLTRWGGGLLLGLMASAVVLSNSKGALLGLASGLGVLFAMRGWKALALYVSMGVLSLLALDTLMAHQFFARVAALFQAEAGQRFGAAASNAHRLCMWWTGLWISLEHFVSGVGLNALERIYPAFRHPLAIEPNQWHLHNNFVQLGVTRGLIGLAAFLYIFLVTFRMGFRLHAVRGQGFDRGLAAGVLGAATAFLVAGFTEFNWGDSEVLMLLYMLLGLLAAREGRLGMTAGAAALPASVLMAGPPAWRGPGQMRRTLLFVSLAAGLCSLAFLCAPVGPFLRMRLWEALLGICLLALAVRGWNQRGKVPVWQRQACGGLAVFVGYRFTQGLWNGRQWTEAPEWTLRVGLIGFLALSLLCFLLLRVFRNGNRGSARLVDLAAIGALWIWAAVALVTHGLLGVAHWREPLGGPPYLPILLLTALSAAVYSGFRFAYSGGRTERILLAALGLCTLLHLFR